MAPRFSILLPTHDRADLLPFSVRSVLAQTIGDFELLIVGDGCTDHTAAVVASFADERIRWFDLPKAPHQGYANRNEVLRQARGELIAYTQDDDLWLPDHLALLSTHLERCDAEIVFSRTLFVWPNGVVSPRIENLDDPEYLDLVMTRRVSLGMTGAMHRRVCFEKYGYLDERRTIAGERDLWPRFIGGGDLAGFAYLPLPTCLHFLASWRRQRRLHRLKHRIRRLEGSLPPELVFPVVEGTRLQETIWLELDRDLERRTELLRRAVQVDLDRRAAAVYPSTVLVFLGNQMRKLLGRVP